MFDSLKFNIWLEKNYYKELKTEEYNLLNVIFDRFDDNKSIRSEEIIQKIKLNESPHYFYIVTFLIKDKNVENWNNLEWYQELKKSSREFSLLVHPDKYGDEFKENANNWFIMLNRVMELLNKAKVLKKKKYNEEKHTCRRTKASLCDLSKYYTGEKNDNEYVVTCEDIKNFKTYLKGKNYKSGTSNVYCSVLTRFINQKISLQIINNYDKDMKSQKIKANNNHTKKLTLFLNFVISKKNLDALFGMPKN